MNKIFLLLIILQILSTDDANARTHKAITQISEENHDDSLRLAELDLYWTNLSKTVAEGDFEGYSAAYHADAVVVFATGENKTSVSLSTALAGWQQGFSDTKEGKQIDMVEFRFSQRIGNENTAHETGIFHYTSFDSNGSTKANSLVHFEMLLVKQGNNWYALMEYQKSFATQKEWDNLK